MMKHEFENLINKTISEEEYNIIEKVYMWYPGITEKSQVANLYLACGINAFCDLLPRAEKAEKISEKIHEIKMNKMVLETHREDLVKNIKAAQKALERSMQDLDNVDKEREELEQQITELERKLKNA